MSRSLLLFALILLALCPALAELPTHLFYTGTLGKYPIQMDLSITDNNLSGQYTYLAFGDALALSGSLDAQGTAMLQERDGNKRSGAFAGQLSRDRRGFTGTWTSANGKRRLPVTLTARAKSFAATLPDGAAAPFTNFVRDIVGIDSMGDNEK